MSRPSPLVLLALLLSTACSDYEINRKGGTNDGGDSGPSDTDLPDTDGTDDPGATEECNGVDDDGDGEVDEDFSDYDEDGIADCVDDDCAVESISAGEVEIDDDCLGTDVEVTDPWSASRARQPGLRPQCECDESNNETIYADWPCWRRCETLRSRGVGVPALPGALQGRRGLDRPLPVP